jgi:hypothetical protein
MSLGPTLVPHTMIKQAVNHRVQDHALTAEPWSTRAFRIEPEIENLARFGFDGVRNRKLNIAY